MVEGAFLFVLGVLVIWFIGDWLHDREVEKMRETFRKYLGSKDDDEDY